MPATTARVAGLGGRSGLSYGCKPMTAKKKSRYAPGTRDGVGGRKPRTGEAATHVLHARVSADEHDAAAAAAERAEMPLAEFVRVAVARAAKKV